MKTLPSKRICFVTPPEIGISETFIQSILDGFDTEDVVHVPYDKNKIETTYKIHLKRKPSLVTRTALAIAPAFIEFRIRKNIYPPQNLQTLFSQVLEKENINLVLAQYGTIAAEILDACKNLNIPLVAHFHGYDCSRRDIIAHYSSRYQALFDYASRIIAVSDRMKNDLILLGCKPHKISRIIYAPHDSFFDITPNYSSDTITMVGRLTEKKGPHLSILAFAKALNTIPNLRLQIIGDGELVGVCKSLVEALQIAQNVVFCGSKDRTFIQKQFENSSAFIQHSMEASNGDREGTPVAILEAGASGLPAITTFHAGIPDVIKQYETGIMVAEGDILSMSNEIIRLYRDRSMLSEMGQKARSHIKSNFTMANHISAIQSIISECVAR